MPPDFEPGRCSPGNNNSTSEGGSEGGRGGDPSAELRALGVRSAPPPAPARNRSERREEKRIRDARCEGEAAVVAAEAGSGNDRSEMLPICGCSRSGAGGGGRGEAGGKDGLVSGSGSGSGSVHHISLGGKRFPLSLSLANPTLWLRSPSDFENVMEGGGHPNHLPRSHLTPTSYLPPIS